MTRHDVWLVIKVFWILTTIQLAFVLLKGRSLDEYDHVHALIGSIGYAIINAIREARDV